MVAPPLPSNAGSGCALGPPHGAGAWIAGVGLGAAGCTIVLPKGGGAGRFNVGSMRVAKEAEVAA